jgi:hypothetical protein
MPTGLEGVLRPVLYNLARLEGEGTLENRRMTTGALDALVNNNMLNNPAISDYTRNRWGGDTPSIIVRYKTPISESLVVEGEDCDQTGSCRRYREDVLPTDEPISTVVCIDPIYGNQLGSNRVASGNSLIDNFVYSFTENAAMDTLAHMQILREKFDTKIMQYINASWGANLGKSPQDANAKSVKLLDLTGTKKLDVGGIDEIIKDYTEANFLKGTPIIIGAGVFGSFNRIQAIGCCNDGGVDISQFVSQYGYQYYLAQKANTVFGVNEFAVIQPQAFHFFTGNAYVEQGGLYGMMGNEIYFNLPDPVYPQLRYDALLKWSGCNDKKWNLKLTLRYASYKAPSDAYEYGGALEGAGGVQSNGILRYLGTQA